MKKKNGLQEKKGEIGWKRTDTKERILKTALKLFAQKGYDGVSVRDIASELSLSQSALYKHFGGKEDILDGIFGQIVALDAERSRKSGVPEEMPSAKNEKEYRDLSLSAVGDFAKESFLFWTENPFGSDFRRLLTIERYKNPKAEGLYQTCLCKGTIDYLTEVFEKNEKSGMAENDRFLAAEFYGILFLFLSVSDGTEDKKAVYAEFCAHTDSFLSDLSNKVE